MAVADLETLLAQGQAGSYPPALTGLRGIDAGRSRPSTRCATPASGRARRHRGHGRKLRPRGGRRRHQRPDGRALLPRAAARPHPGPRQPRRLRRPRQAQRVHPQRPHLIGYGGTHRSTARRPTARWPRTSSTSSASRSRAIRRWWTRASTVAWPQLGFFFDKETFGADRLLAGDLRDDEFLAAAPSASGAAQSQAAAGPSASTRCRASARPRRRRASRRSATQTSSPNCGGSTSACSRSTGRDRTGSSASASMRCRRRPPSASGPGFAAMDLDPTPGPGENFDSISSKGAEGYFFRFPGATHRSAASCEPCPGRPSGSTMDDIVTARPTTVGWTPRAPVGSCEQPGDAGAAHRPGRRGRPWNCVPAERRARSRPSRRPSSWRAGLDRPYLRPNARRAGTALVHAIKVPLVYADCYPMVEGLSEAGVERVSTPGMWPRSAWICR